MGQSKFNTLKVSSFNCKNIKTSLPEILLLCKSCDVVFLQETWLCDQELSSLSTIHKDFYGRGVSSVDTSSGVISGRPHGGLGILWKKSLGQSCRIIESPDERIMQIELALNGKIFNLFNVYLPYDNGSNIEDYREYLTKLIDLLEQGWANFFDRVPILKIDEF